MPGDELIQVVFVDAGTGTEMGRSDMPIDQVPQDLDTETTVQIGDSRWAVEGVDRPADRTLILTVRRMETVATQDILYSMPTICDVLPLTDDADAGERLEMHEDDWRQIEFVDARLADVVAEQLEAIEHVHSGRVGAGFRQIHIRSEPLNPLPAGISKRELLSLLDAVEDGRGVGFRGQPGVVPGSFTATVGSLVLYGVARGDTIKVLGLLEPAAMPKRVLETFGLLLVDWSKCVVQRGL